MAVPSAPQNFRIVTGDYFPGLGSDEWLNLEPTLSAPGTSQMVAGLDETGDQLVTYGGHTSGGGYPQIDWVGLYDINGGNQSTWRIPQKYTVAGSTSPPACCEINLQVDPVNRVMPLFGHAGYTSTRNEWARRYNLCEIARKPFVYDIVSGKWYLAGILDFVDYSFTSRSAFDYSKQKIFHVNMNHGSTTNKRYCDFDAHMNAVSYTTVAAYNELGIGRGDNGFPRADLGVVYDSNRDRYWVVGGCQLTNDEGPNNEYQTVWYTDTTSISWTKETGVTPEEYFVETWDYAENLTQWTANSGSVSVSATAKEQGEYGLLVSASDPDADAYVYKNLSSQSKVRTWLRYFKVASDGMSNGEKTKICSHMNQTNGEVASLWLVKSGGNLYLDVQLTGGTPTTGFQIAVNTTYRLGFETYVNASGWTRLFVNAQEWTGTPDISRTGDKTSVGNVDRLKVGVFDENKGNITCYFDTINHWNPNVHLCYAPWVLTTCTATYDPIHDKIILFNVYYNIVQSDTYDTGDLESMVKVFIYDPDTKTWTAGADRPAPISLGPRRSVDFSAIFSDTYNVVFLQEMGRPGTGGPDADNNGTTWVYRYDTDTSGYTPHSLTRTSTAPAFPKFGYVEMLSATSAKVNWDAVAGVDGYNVYRAEITFTSYSVGEDGYAAMGGNDFSSYPRAMVKTLTKPVWSDFTKLNGSLVTDTYYTDSTISAVYSGGATVKVYAYIVKASKNSTLSGCSPFWCTLPEFPTGVTVTKNTGASTWDVSWTASHDGGNGIAGYRIIYTPTTNTIAELTGADPYPVTGTSASVPFAQLGGTTSAKIFVVPIDDLGQEGFPSNGAWTFHPEFDSFYAGYIA